MKKLCLIILIICVGSCFPAYADTRVGAPLEKVTIQLKWFHQFQFAGYYAAKEKGFYQQEGLDVTIVPGGPEVKVADAVEAGEADFGVLGSELVLERLKGKKLVLTAVIFQHSPRALMVDARSGILAPADLAGKPIMLNIPESAEFMAMFAREGIPRNSLIISTKDKTAMDKLVAGEIAAMNGNIANQPFLLRQRGMPVRLIRPVEYGVNFFGDSLFTSEQFLKNHPEQAAAFWRATIRGWEYALSNVDEIIDLIIEKYASKKTRDHLKFEAAITQSLILPDLVSIGHVTPRYIDRIVDTYAELGFAPEEHGVPEGFIYRPPLADKQEILLTLKEQAWLKENHTVRARISQWPPYMFISPRVEGLTVDYLKRMTDLYDITIEFIPSEMPFVKAIHDIETDNRFYDLHPSMMRTPERLKRFAMTETYYSSPWVIITRNEVQDIKTIDDLNGKVVAIERGFVMYDLLKKNYPGMKLDIYKTTQEALLALATAKVVAYVGNFAVANYIMLNKGLINLKVIGTTPFGEQDHAIGIRKDWAPLASLYNKWLETLTEADHTAIHRKWIHSLGKAKVHKNTLSPDEQAWLKEHPVVRVGADPVWAPLEFKDESGAFQGISIDYLERLREMLGIEFEFIDKPTWSEMLEMAKTGELDILSSVKRTPYREQFLSFTDSYIEMPIVVFSGPELTFVGDLDELNGHRVAVVKGYATEELLTADHPNIDLVPTESTIEALHLLARNEVDAFVGDILTTSYYLGQLGYTQIKIAGDTPYINNQTMGVRKDWPVLTGILQKALNTIPHQERIAIRQQWVAVKYEHGFNYSILWKVIIAALVVVAMFSYWNWMLKRQVRARTSELASINKSLESEINERNLAENALKESEDLLNRTGDIAKVGGWQVDIEARKVIWTQTTGRIHELPDDYLPDLAEAINFYHPDDREMVREFVNRAIETGKSFEFDARLITAKGRQTWVRALGQSAFKAGKCVRLSGTFQDITERKETEDKLKQQLDELQRWHGLTSDRENRVMELKREVNGLLRRLGKPVRYSSQTDSHEEGNTTDAD